MAILHMRIIAILTQHHPVTSLSQNDFAFTIQHLHQRTIGIEATWVDLGDVKSLCVQP